MAEIKTACSSCAKNDVCKHVESIEKIEELIKKENTLGEELRIEIGCKYSVKILQPVIGYRN